MLARLRRDVDVERNDAGFRLVDRLTGLCLDFEADSALLDAPEPTTDEGREIWETIESLGLIEAGLTQDEVRARQRELRRDAAQAEQAGRLEELLSFCVERVPFYRERAATYAPEAIAERGLASLPMLRKSDLRANFPANLVAEGIDVDGRLREGSLELSATSGTTGERLQTFCDMELQAFPDEWEKLWRVGPFDDEPRTAVFTSPTCLGMECHLGKTPYEERIRGGSTLLLNSHDDVFAMRRPLVENIAEELARFRPHLMLVNPVYLHCLVRRAQELGIALHAPAFVLSSYQYCSRLQRRAIEEGLKTRVFDYYAATDLAGARLGVECEHGRVHVREDHVLLETVGADGQPVPEDELGAVCLTTVAGRVVPLVRYLVGDVAKLGGEPCTCALSHWQTVEVHGRAKDLMRVGGRWVTTRQLDDALADVSWLDFYKCAQQGESLEVEAIAAPGRTVDVKELEDKLRARLGASSVKVRLVKRLDPEVSLKFRLTQSHDATPPEVP